MPAGNKFITDAQSFLVSSQQTQFKVSLIAKYPRSEPGGSKIVIVFKMSIFTVPAEATISYVIYSRDRQRYFILFCPVKKFSIVVEATKITGFGIAVTESKASRESVKKRIV